MSAHSASYTSSFGDTQNDRDKGERVCDHPRCISLAESDCGDCQDRFCDDHVYVVSDKSAICWACMQRRIDETTAALNSPRHCTTLYTEADLCSPF